MADQSYRAYRSRDPNPNAGSVARGIASDPLAELARLIGQSDPVAERARLARRGSVQTLDQPPARPASRDLEAGKGYAETAQYQESHHVEPRFGESYADGDDREYEPELPDAAVQFPVRAPSFNGTQDSPVEDGQYLYDSQQVDSSQQLPVLASQSDGGYETDQQWQETTDGESYAVDGYHEVTPGARRPNGIVLTLAVLALMGVGVAGAFAYHGMIGRRMFPSLPPIIKASDGPNKIAPKHTDAQADASSQTGAANGAGEKLVSREEQPLNIQTPPDNSPRVVSTIPVLPDPGAAAQVAPSPAQAAMAPSPAVAGVPPAPVAGAPAAPAPALPPPAAAAVNPAAPATASTEPKKVHTVVIRAGQAANAPMPTNTPARGTVPRGAMAATPRAGAAPRADANAPLALIPQPGEVSPRAPQRTRFARADDAGAPMETSPGTVRGGYLVQVSSQRSEVEAQASFRALRAKFPTELGGREPMIRRADLGDKGTYYRALVGPYASVEQAAGVCSKIKAAGGTCLVQKN